MKNLAEALALKFPHTKRMEFPVHAAPWLPELLKNADFLAASPEFGGVSVELPLSAADSETLSTAYSERYGWAYDNLKASAKRHGIIDSILPDQTAAFASRLPGFPLLPPDASTPAPPVPTAHRDRQPLVDAISSYLLTAAPHEAVVLRPLVTALAGGQTLSLRGLALALLAAEV